MKTIPPQTSRSAPAFTLLEVLVSIAILAMLIVLLAQISGMSSRSLRHETSRSEAYARARSAMDILATDIALGVFREDLGAFRDGGGNPAFAFYTRRAGLSGERQFSLVSYQAGADATMRRAALPLDWDETRPLGFGDATSVPRFGDIAAGDYQEILSGILRLELYFVGEDGSLKQIYDRECRALGIALVIMDTRDLALLGDSQITALQAEFTSVAQPGSTYAERWGERINEAGFADDLPAGVHQNIQVFERFVSLPE